MRALAALALVLTLAPFAAAQDPCNGFYIQPTGRTSVTSNAYDLTIELYAPVGCSYTLSTDARWLYVYPDSVVIEQSGMGYDVSISWDANEYRYARTGNVLIQGPADTQLYTIEQAPYVPPTPTPEPTSEGYEDPTPTPTAPTEHDYPDWYDPNDPTWYNPADPTRPYSWMTEGDVAQGTPTYYTYEEPGPGILAILAAIGAAALVLGSRSRRSRP